MAKILKNLSIALVVAGMASAASGPAGAQSLGGLGDALGGVVGVDASNGLSVSIGGSNGISASLGGSDGNVASVSVGGAASVGVSAGSNGANAGVSVGKGGSVASVGASIGGQGLGANVSVARGSVADLGVSLGSKGIGLSGSVLGLGINRNSPAPATSNPPTNGRSPTVPSGVDNTVSKGRLGSALAGLSPREVMRMKQRCRDITSRPSGYDQGLVDLCWTLGRMASR